MVVCFPEIKSVVGIADTPVRDGEGEFPGASQPSKAVKASTKGETPPGRGKVPGIAVELEMRVPYLGFFHSSSFVLDLFVLDNVLLALTVLERAM